MPYVLDHPQRLCLTWQIQQEFGDFKGEFFLFVSIIIIAFNCLFDRLTRFFLRFQNKRIRLMRNNDFRTGFHCLFNHILSEF